MGDIAYQNKDIASKLTAEMLVGKSLAPFGLPDLKVTGLLPTNLPVIESNELRLDNLFLLDDGSVAIIDYESVFTKENFVKYLNYVARVVKRYADRKQLEELKQIKVFVIYTADVDWAADEYDLGDLILKIEAAYLVGQNTDAIYESLCCKIHRKELLTAEDLAQLMILPLTVKGKDAKRDYIEKSVNLARQITDREQVTRVLAGILTFSDKVIDPAYANKIKEELCMTQVGQLIFNDGFEKGIEQGIERGIERGIEQGIEQGIRRGVQALIKTCKNLGVKREEVQNQIEQGFSVSKERAEEYMRMYWE